MTRTQARRQPTVPTDQVENIKDTIESLVIAFILAFVFRGFLVEAFVIPTGSMAPTLYGKHGTQICPDCGWEYAYGLPDRHPERERIRCPNCNWGSASHVELPYHGPRCTKYDQWFGSNLERMNPRLAEQVSHLSFEPQSGDRILVFKWPFDLGGPVLDPQPWDVVVFKNPLNGEDNYIKRLIGVPGEVLEIIEGDVYTCSVDELDEQTRKLLGDVVEWKHRLVYPSEGSDSPKSEIRKLQRKLVGVLNHKLTIRRKTPSAEKSLWRVVFHQDYLPPRTVRRSRPRWAVRDARAAGSTGFAGAGASRWDASTPRIRFDGQDHGRQTLQFTGKRITDFYAYNSGSPGSEAEEPVGDLRMKFVLEYSGGDGVLGLSLSKRDDVFTAEFSPDGEVSLVRTKAGTRPSPQVLEGARIPPWEPGKPLQVEFGNVDYRVYIKINGRDEPLFETTDEDYAPVISELRRKPSRSFSGPRAQIYADHLDITLAHLVLERDVHYKNSSPKNYRGWGTTGNPIFLREGEYFVLGDNSPASQDSRLWTQPGAYLLERGEEYQVGTVPADQLIGKAFFVYWPSGYRIEWLPVLKRFGVIPNVGKMRWIR